MFSLDSMVSAMSAGTISKVISKRSPEVTEMTTVAVPTFRLLRYETV